MYVSNVCLFEVEKNYCLPDNWGNILLSPQTLRLLCSKEPDVVGALSHLWHHLLSTFDHQIGVIDQRYKEPNIVGALLHLRYHLLSKFEHKIGVIDQRYELMFVISVLITVMT